MRIGGSDDAQPVPGGKVEVAVNIPLRIDDDGVSGSRTANQIGELGELWVGNLSNKHDFLRAADTGASPGAAATPTRWEPVHPETARAQS